MVDYDGTTIPEGYDRARDHGPEALALWMSTIESRVHGRPIRRILDLGCGTGRFSQALATRFDVEVVGVDPSQKMLSVARGKPHEPRVHYQEGRAEAIPLEAKSVDMVFTSMTFHHFSDRPLVARECRRVLSDGGVLVVRAGTREQIDSYAYIPFIPVTRALHEEVLPSVSEIRDTFEGAGFRLVSSELVTQTIAPTWAVYAEKLAAGGDSVLARVSAAELEAGLERVRRHAAAVDPQPVTEPIDLLVFEVAPTG
ncbi:MAG TPA: methyltransferase domain-containing protein [Gemmatimonadaceae bacterium]|nr:methyltransferase domain-containing protein [Gemmatimonadaceae bacterium]